MSNFHKIDSYFLLDLDQVIGIRYQNSEGIITILFKGTSFSWKGYFTSYCGIVDALTKERVQRGNQIEEIKEQLEEIKQMVLFLPGKGSKYFEAKTNFESASKIQESKD